jgi:hypothetical protein
MRGAIVAQRERGPDRPAWVNGAYDRECVPFRFTVLERVIDEAAVETIGDFVDTAISKEFPPVLAGALDFQAESLSVPPGTLEPAESDNPYRAEDLLLAEILPTPAGLVALEVARDRDRRVVVGERGPEMLPGEARLRLYGIGEDAAEGDLREIATLIEDHYSIRLEPYRYRSSKLRKLKSQGGTSPDPPSAERIESARALSERAVRDGAAAVASSGGGLVAADLPKHLDAEGDRAAQVQRALLMAGIVKRELIVTCTRRSTQVARAPSHDALKQMSARGIKCACGREIVSERIDEALTLTPHGRELLTGSFWMLVLVMTELHDLGVEYEDMLIEQASGDDEIDVFADIGGKLILLGLKDKEFNLANAYFLGSKMSAVGPDLSIAVSSLYVSKDAREHFEQAAAAERAAAPPWVEAHRHERVRFIEGIDRLRPELETLVRGIYTDEVANILGRLLPRGSASASSVAAGLQHRLIKATTSAEPRSDKR